MKFCFFYYMVMYHWFLYMCMHGLYLLVTVMRLQEKHFRLVLPNALTSKMDYMWDVLLPQEQ